MTTKMTRADALAEAQRRWGENAYVSRGPITGRYGVGVTYFHPHQYLPPQKSHDECKGSGDSWEAAFRDADRRSPLDPRD